MNNSYISIELNHLNNSFFITNSTNVYKFPYELNSTNIDQNTINNYTAFSDYNHTFSEFFISFTTSKSIDSSNKFSPDLYNTTAEVPILFNNSTIETERFSTKEILTTTTTTTTITNDVITTSDKLDSIFVDLIINGILPNDYDLEKSSTVIQSTSSKNVFFSSSLISTTSPILEHVNSTNLDDESDRDIVGSIELEANNILQSKLNGLLNISNLTSFGLNASELEIFIDFNYDSSENQFTTISVLKNQLTSANDEKINVSSNMGSFLINNSTKNQSSSINYELNIYDTPQPLSNFNNISSLINTLFKYNKTTTYFNEYQIDSNINKTNILDNSTDIKNDSLENSLTTKNTDTIISTTQNNLIESDNSTHYLIDWCEFVYFGLVPSCQNGNLFY